MVSVLWWLSSVLNVGAVFVNVLLYCCFVGAIVQHDIGKTAIKNWQNNLANLLVVLFYGIYAVTMTFVLLDMARMGNLAPCQKEANLWRTLLSYAVVASCFIQLFHVRVSERVKGWRNDAASNCHLLEGVHTALSVSAAVTLGPILTGNLFLVCCVVACILLGELRNFALILSEEK